MNRLLGNFLLLLGLAASANTIALELQGVWQQGALIQGQVSPTTQVVFQGRPLRLTEDGHFVFGL